MYLSGVEPLTVDIWNGYYTPLGYHCILSQIVQIDTLIDSPQCISNLQNIKTKCT